MKFSLSYFHFLKLPDVNIFSDQLFIGKLCIHILSVIKMYIESYLIVFSPVINIHLSILSFCLYIVHTVIIVIVVSLYNII